MNKPVIQGTKKHSALLKTAKAEQVRTHGGDPSLIEASALYGASNSPDVIDYKIKQAEIKWKKKKKKTKVEKDMSTTEVTTPTPTPTEVSTEEALAEVPTITELEKLTVNERNWEIAKADEEAAKKRLEDTTRKKDTPGQYYERGSQERVGLPSAKNLVEPTNVYQEDIDLGRVIMTEDGYREAKWWTKQKKKVTKKSKGKDDTSPHPDERLTKSEWLKLGTEEEKEKKVVEKKKVKKTTVKSEKKAEKSTISKTNKPKVEDFRKENNMINMKEYFKALREWKTK